MRAWLMPEGCDGFDKLYMDELPDPQPGKGEIVVAPTAWSLNYRDFAVAAGKYFGGPITEPSIPLSDGAGKVVALGEGVKAVRVGDMVQSTFFQGWYDGPPKMVPALGDGKAPGMLAEKVVLGEHGVVPIARSLDVEQAACLPCAGVTAWNALFEGGRPLQSGDKVLVLGTGGVSMIALKLAKAAGAEVIATSSSDEKLEEVKALGADHTINYKTTPDWGNHVKEQFGGADKIVEVGGTGTLEQSMNACAPLAEIALIGVLADGTPPEPRGLMFTGSSIRGIFVGSKRMAGDLNAFIDKHHLTFPVGKTFAFEDADKAYAFGWGPDSFGKTVITLG
ncbi:zinc-dependent alcohol dehydrogenase family protein [Aurantiacibacter poecillastricola]|uniref:zinc-dependent alcohol dehydrogenase family protein n=1 Tax=Aurantiacibacter poecillastricola TaxID=3064385 RepID=UPI00273D6E78|nr:NAD(P)-dependent alcohol dehydrogenase [Aurantiacibacter sp. 219JJ12-13]MDP5260860.1 NAD(P)-dependent alcohol dehydrogenase [Aurantiacibacter sp. 219JJ12-13]